MHKRSKQKLIKFKVFLKPLSVLLKLKMKKKSCRKIKCLITLQFFFLNCVCVRGGNVLSCFSC